MMVGRSRFKVGVLACIAGLLLAACGSPGETGDGAETREVTDGTGTLTVIPANPQRVIAADHSTFAHLVSLGVNVVGAALPEGVPTEYFSPGGIDVPNVVAEDGWTIDLDKALELEPDLIVTVAADWNQENIDRYKASPVPTYAFEDGWESMDHIYTQFRRLAADLGRSDQGEEAITNFETKLADGKETLASHVGALGKTGIVRVSPDEYIGIRVEDPVASAILPGLGLTTPPWPAPDNDGYYTLSLETLEELNAADTLFVETDGEPAENLPALQSEVWQTLTPAKNDQVIVFASKWWSSDLLMMGSIVDEIVTAVTSRG